MTKLAIQGMTCGHCQRAVKEALEAVVGVNHVDVSLDAHLATVEGDTDPQALIAAVQEEATKRASPPNGGSCRGCKQPRR